MTEMIHDVSDPAGSISRELSRCTCVVDPDVGMPDGRCDGCVWSNYIEGPQLLARIADYIARALDEQHQDCAAHVADMVADERSACRRDAELAWEKYGGDDRFLEDMESRINARSNE